MFWRLWGSTKTGRSTAVPLHRDDRPARGSRRSRIRPDRLFVVDGAKALIAQVFGAGNEVPLSQPQAAECRRPLPNAQHDHRVGSSRLRRACASLTNASWLQRDWPDAAASVREGLDEIFTVNRLGLPASLRTCLTTEHHRLGNPAAHTSSPTNGEMALRWSAVAFVETEKLPTHHRLRASLDAEGTPIATDNIAEMQKVG